jgi:hypothetical protein
MSRTLKRLLAAGIAAAVAFVGPAAVPQAQAKAASPVARTSTWLAGYEFTVDDGFGARINAALGLAVLDRKADAAVLRTKLAELSTGSAQVAGKPGDAATLAILADIVHADPTNFGGTDLIKALLDSTDPTTGQVGNFGSAYAQAIAIIALKRANQPVPAPMVTKLLEFRDATSGAFGYDFGGFVADPDSTALAIQALYLVRHHKAEIAKAAAWAKSIRTKDGYWDSYSPVDSTALMGSAFKLIGKSYSKSKSWLLKQQLADGGFPASLGGTSSDLYATHDATFLLAGESLARSSYHLAGYTKSPRPRISGIVKVGQTLTVTNGTWAPVPQFSTQWLRNGKKIAGATATTYVLTTADRGKRIRVKVVATGLGLKKKVEVSRPTRTVKP